MGDEPPVEDDQGNVVNMQDDQSDTGAEPPVFTFPTPGGMQPGGNNPVFVPMPGQDGQPGTVTAPVITLQPGTNGPAIYNFVPADEAQQPPAQATPTGAFGVIGAPTPGMIQVPQPSTVRPVRPVTRPPGGQ